MPEQAGAAWLAQLLGPGGLVVGCLYALWMFTTERWTTGAALKRAAEQNEKLLEQNAALLRQNEAQQRRIDRLASVTGKVVDAADTVAR